MSKAKSLKVLVVLLPSPVLRSTRPPGGDGGDGGMLDINMGHMGKGHWICFWADSESYRSAIISLKGDEICSSDE